MAPPTSPVPTEVAAEEGQIEEELSVARSRQRTGSLTAVGIQGTSSSSLPAAPPPPEVVSDDLERWHNGVDAANTAITEEIERFAARGRRGRDSYFEHEVPRSYRPLAWTGHWKMGMPKCASDNCPYACTGPASYHCCRGCGTNNGKHSNTCATCWHVPAVSEWVYNHWLVDGMPTRYALLLPNERKAFNKIRLSPDEFNSMNTVELGCKYSLLRTNVPQDTVTPPASDNGAPVVPWHLPVGQCYDHDRQYKTPNH